MEDPIPQRASFRAWARERQARLLLVFGSAVAPEGPGPMSDLDIAIEFSEVPPPDERLAVVREIQALVDP